MKAMLLTCLLAIFLPLAAARPPKAPPAPVDLNTATATELMQLPGIGAKTAARILEHRRSRGPFRRPEAIMEVKGIGEKAFLRLKPHIRAGDVP